jgi:hypothetical protein
VYDHRGAFHVVGATCPALDGEGKECCAEPIPWAKVIDSGIFQADEERALEIYQSEMLNRRIQESSFLHSCPGACGRIALAGTLPDNASNEVDCEQCKVVNLSIVSARSN